MRETLTIDRARERGATSVSQLLAQLPFTTTTQSRGETGLSLRGARREQTAITLDGLLLNDPTSGVADVSDIPLAALGSATVALGADPVGVGPGASGGVLALTSAAANQLSVRVGGFGAAGIDAAASRPLAGVRWSAALMSYHAKNDFRFVNAAGASPISETRTNSDETRRSLMLGALGGSWQLAALVSHHERGMVGAANVHTYDADRAYTDRALVRATTMSRVGALRASVREFTLAYRDPTRPQLDADARARALDVEGSLSLRVRSVAVDGRVGGGADAVRATGDVRQSRARAFASVQSVWSGARGTLDAGARVDAMERGPTLPSLSLSTEFRPVASVTLGARAAQAVRAPTLYDLYFSSSQRLNVRALRPERVTADLELSARSATRTAIGALSAHVAVVARDTRDAIVWFPGNFGWSPANVGRESMRGAEAQVALHARQIEVRGFTSWYDTQLRTDALRIPTPYIPRWSGGGQLVSSFGRSTATARARITGRRPFTAGPRNADFELPAVSLLDVVFTHPWPHTLTPRATMLTTTWSLENATDVAWQSVRGFPSPGRSWAVAFSLQHTPQ
jgi:outer membrane cobalamin receptor